MNKQQCGQLADRSSKSGGGCSKTFTIYPEDQAFYDRIAVPAPTLCPDCRNTRRMSWRNDRTFYIRNCDLSGERFVSMYPADTSFPVYKPSVWYGDSWDPLNFGMELDIDKPFFEQWGELMQKVPRLGIDIVNCENSDYCNYCGDNKNCYLDIAGEGNEDCYYNLFTKFSRNVADSTFVYESELVYESISSYNCYNVIFSQYVYNSRDCAFSFDLRGCSDVLFSSNLRNKQYYIFNQQYSEEEYHKKKTELEIGNYKRLAEHLTKWEQVKAKAIHKYSYQSNSDGSTGNNLKNCYNVQEGYNVSNSESSKYLYDVLDAKDCYDLNYSLYKPELAYDIISTLQMRHSAFSMASHYCTNVFYVDQCNNSSDLFGCIGLNKAQYCILNTQYTQSEYERLTKKLIAAMHQRGEWGEFFPTALSPFGYNETVAQEYYPLTESDAVARGYKWTERDRSATTTSFAQLEDRIEDVEVSVAGKVLQCEQCQRGYKLIAQEIDLYKQLSVPAPRKCPDCRHQNRLAQRNQRHLWNSQCMCTQPEHDHSGQCNETFLTTYNPDSVEITYCEECYSKEIY